MLYYVRYVNGVIDNVRTFNLLKLDIQQKKKKKKTSPMSTLTDASMSLEAFQQSEQLHIECAATTSRNSCLIIL